ncbi:MAG: hypothetical protein A3F78_20795 [Burkholderiales bacterium RIFCSPLOWO2_12_FULL_61_40]|nr:MAG: hypothetical protein A3F78_20795 [Burkholderiales bacterium RIFCSPLOWO2_12_FULL_61_40]
MQAVHRTSLLEEAAAAKNAIRSDASEVICNIVNDVFDSLQWTSVSGSIVQNVAALDEWRHRSLSDIEKDWAYLEFDRNKILVALSRYLDQEHFKSKRLDWLFLNVLVYAEYIATIDEVRRRLLGVDAFVMMKIRPIDQHTYDVHPLLKKWWHWPLALAAVAISFTLHPVATLLPIGAITAGIYKRNKAVGKINLTLHSMLTTYLSLNTFDLGWGNVKETLKESKNAGAIFDSSVFSLVERRIPSKAY